MAINKLGYGRLTQIGKRVWGENYGRLKHNPLIRSVVMAGKVQAQEEEARVTEQRILEEYNLLVKEAIEKLRRDNAGILMPQESQELQEAI